MKLLAGAVLLASMGAQGNDITKNCVSIGELGKVIMERRQEGVDIGKMLEVSQTFKTQTERDVSRLLIIEAYNQPHFNTQEYRDNAATEFYNNVIVACLQSSS